MAELLALLLLLTDAQAITQDDRGYFLELGLGGGAAVYPWKPEWAGDLSVGYWFGPYDHAFAVGRYNALALRPELTWSAQGAGVGGLIEWRRGFDLIVANVHGLLAGGAQVVGGEVSPMARVGFGARYRRTRFWSIGVRFQAGADVWRGQVLPMVDGRLTVSFARPSRRVE
jgi:hypothetical protein